MANPEKELTEDEQFAAAIKGSAAFDQLPDEPGDNPEGAAADPAVAPVPAPEGADDPAATDDPQGEPAAEPAAGADPAAAGPAADEPFPGYSTLAPEARAAYDQVVADKLKAENNYRALHGMTAPLQRGNQELQRQHDALVARIQQLEQQGRKQKDVSAGTDELITGFDEWAKEYPEESRAIAALVNPLREKVAALEAGIGNLQTGFGSLVEDKQRSAIQVELDALTHAHPDWQEINKEPAYQEWLQNQSPGIQALTRSMYAGDSIELLNKYKRDTAPVTTNAQANVADAVKQRRTHALERGTQPTVRTTESRPTGPANQGDLSDEDAMFARLVEGNPNFR